MADLDTTAVPGAPASPAEATLSFQELMRGVPPAVRAYLLSSELAATRESVYAAARLTAEDREACLDVESDVFFGLIPLPDFPDALWSELPWPDSREAEAKALALQLLGQVMLPARAYLGDVAAVIARLGGAAAAFPQKEMPPREVAYEDGVLGVVRVFDPANAMDLDKRERLEQLLEDRFRGRLGQKELGDRLIRAYKLGGFEASPEQAGLIAALAQNEALLTNFSENPPEPPSLEEAIGSVDGEEGERSPDESSTASAFTQEEIRKRYAGSAEEQKRLKAVVEKCASLPDGAAKAAQVAFAPASVRRDPWDIAGSLLFLAQTGQLVEAAAASPAYAEAVRNLLAAQGRMADVGAFAADPSDTKFLTLFLRIALQRYAGLSAADSARLGLRIANLLKKQGVSMPDVAAFDPAIGDFRWLIE